MFLKAAFPVDVRSDTAAYEIPFAAIHRPTGFKTLREKARFEVPALKWADLSQEEYGISLLNDCKYGYDIHGNVMKLSLLRSPVWPDPTADRGKHTFVYSLYTHKGKWSEAETVRRATELNSPLLTIITGSHRGILPAEFSFCSLQSPGIILDTVKKEENGDGFILRLYEARGKDEKTEIRLFKNPTDVYETDLMENMIKGMKHRGGKIPLDFKKFEIKTILVRFAPAPASDSKK
jgi:alpha-mannosidase